MLEITRTGFGIGVLGGCGLGLLLGSEFSGSFVTLGGSGLLAFTLVYMAARSGLSERKL